MLKKVVLYQHFDNTNEYLEASVSRCNICNEMFQIRKGFYLKDNILSCYKHDIKNGACDGGVEAEHSSHSTGSDNGGSNT